MAISISPPSGSSTKYFSGSATGESSKPADLAARSQIGNLVDQSSSPEHRHDLEFPVSHTTAPWDFDSDDEEDYSEVTDQDHWMSRGSRLNEVENASEASTLRPDADGNIGNTSSTEIVTVGNAGARSDEEHVAGDNLGSHHALASDTADNRAESPFPIAPLDWHEPRTTVTVWDLVINQTTHSLEIILDHDCPCPLDRYLRQRIHDGDCHCLCHLGEGEDVADLANESEAYAAWLNTIDMFPSTPCHCQWEDAEWVEIDEDGDMVTDEWLAANSEPRSHGPVSAVHNVTISGSSPVDGPSGNAAVFLNDSDTTMADLISRANNHVMAVSENVNYAVNSLTSSYHTVDQGRQTEVQRDDGKPSLRQTSRAESSLANSANSAVDASVELRRPVQRSTNQPSGSAQATRGRKIIQNAMPFAWLLDSIRFGVFAAILFMVLAMLMELCL